MTETVDDTLTVFVVDDNQSLLGLYNAWFADYNVVTAATESEAIETVSEDYDIALVDRSLPDGKGLAVVEHMAEHDIDIPVVLVSARDMLPENELHELVVDQLTKPMGKEDVVETIQTIVSNNE